MALLSYYAGGVPSPNLPQGGRDDCEGFHMASLSYYAGGVPSPNLPQGGGMIYDWGSTPIV